MTPQQNIDAVQQQLTSDIARLMALEDDVKATRERITAGRNFLAGVELQKRATEAPPAPPAPAAEA